MHSTVIEIKNASLGYNHKPVIENYNLTINSGTKILLLGQNGTGKSTLLKSILNLIPVISGSIKKYASVSYCKQDYKDINFPVTVNEIVSMGLYGRKISSSEKQALVEKSLEKSGALHLKNRLFNTLSGGERQRVSLARCFCQDSKLILLDEPSSFMDKESRNSLIELLKSDSVKDIAIIAVTHDDFVIQSLNWQKIILQA